MSILKAISEAIGSLFSSGPVKAPVETKTYNERLVESFKSDHREMVSTFGKLKAAVEQRDNAKFIRELGDLGTELNAHTAKENRDFYTYLEQKYFAEEKVFKRLRDFRAEMETIKHAIGALVKKYVPAPKEEPQPLSQADWQVLDQAIAELGQILVNRIQSEETELYGYYTK